MSFLTPLQIFLRFARGALGLGLLSSALGEPSRLINLSARSPVGPDGDPLVAGFVVSGETGKTLLLRAVGPTLEPFGVTGVLADPTLTIFSKSTVFATNDDWSAAANSAQLSATATNVGAFPLPASSRDAALLPTFSGGGFTAQVDGKSGASGVALLEIYDAATTNSSRLINLSARARVGQAGSILIAGFAIEGTAPLPLLIRGVGPGLTTLGFPGALADPQLALFRQGATTALLQNDNWAGAAQLKAAASGTGAFTLSDTSKDAVILATLDPGVYTAQLSGVGSATGVGLIEIYDATAASAAPVIAAQPLSLTPVTGATASLTIIATSLTPLSFEWRKDGVPIAGATSDTLTFTNLQAAQAGSYTVTVSNQAGTVASAPATVALATTSTALPPVNTFDLVGFATLGTGTTGGGVLPVTDPNYHVLDASITNKAQQLRTWLESATTMVIDVQVDVDLGALNNLANRPKTNPDLIASGLGTISVRSNKTLFSSTGAALRHGALNISGQSNIIVRNLRFRGLWEFDEGSQNAPDNAPWGYKIQDWDYVTIQNSSKNIWIDHCDFEKAYDGLADTKLSADLVTFSWCRFGGDSEGNVARQVAYLEKLYQGTLTDSRVTFTFYKGLRDGAYAAQGIPRQSVQSIIEHELPHDKCNLVGSSDTDTQSIGYLNMTFHHIYYHGVRQRTPRMRFGNAHVFNLYIDNALILDGTNQGTATTCDAAVFAENSLYSEIADPFPAQSGTSPAGRLAQLGCRWIYKGVEQSFATNTFLKNPATWTWNTGAKNFTWSAAPAPNALALPYSYTADPVDYTKNNLAYIGVIVPANGAAQATLANYLLRPTH